MHATNFQRGDIVMKTAASVFCTLALLVGLRGPSPAASVAGPPYEINVLVPLTGGGAFLGKSYTESFRALEIAVNASGGIQGHPLKFILNDTQTSPQTGLQIVNGLIAKHVALFIDGGPSTVCLSTVPIVLKSGPVDYCLSPVIHPPVGSFVFSSSVSNADQAKTGVRYLRERGWTRIAMITSTDSTGEDYERQTDAALQLPENKNVQIVDRQHFNPTDVSAAAQIAHIKASGAQAVLAWTTGTPLGTVLRGVKDVGLELPLETAASNMTYAQMAAYANIMPKELYFTALLAITPGGTRKGPLHDAQAAYDSAFKAINVRPDEGHILAWDPSMILVDALRHLGTNATADQIRNYVVHLHGWVGINGVYDFGAGDQRGINDNASAIARWDETKGAWIRVSKPRGFL
jgi:branched-chain amino acid transport system substrate-binding protein